MRGGQYVADPQVDDVVVFVIGMRINRLRRVRSLVARVRRHAARMLRGWRAAERRSGHSLGARSLSRARPRRASSDDRRRSTGDVGIFHETYVVPADRVESVYGNMTEFGLAAAFGSVERGRGRVVRPRTSGSSSTEPDYVDAST